MRVQTPPLSTRLVSTEKEALKRWGWEEGGGQMGAAGLERRGDGGGASGMGLAGNEGFGAATN